MAADAKPSRSRARRPRLGHEEQQLQLIDAAMRRFGRDGYASTTVAGIVEEARMSRSTFYRHFADREDALVACLDHLLTAVLTVVGPLIVDSTDRRDRQVEVIRRLLAVLDEQAAFAPVLLMETIGGSPRATARLWGALDELSALVTRSDQLAESALGRPHLRLPKAETALVGAFYVWLCEHIRSGTLAEIGHDQAVSGLVVDAIQAARAALVTK